MLKFIFFLWASSAWGIGVYHEHRPFSTFESLSATSFCAIDTIQAPFTCAPGLYGKKSRQNVSFNINLKADGDAVDNGQKLLLEEIDESTLRGIFEGENFNSFTFDSRIEFNTPYMSIYYSPYYLVADSLLQNPALPELSLFLAKKSDLGVASSYDPWSLVSLGARAGYQTIKSARSQLSLLDIATNDVDRLVKFESVYSPSVDLSASFWGTDFHPLLPYVTLQAKNLFSGHGLKRRNLEGADYLEPFTLFEKHYQLTIGRIFLTDIGTLKIGVNGFADAEEKVYDDFASLGVGYDLNKFSLNITGAKFRKSLGFVFKSRVMDIGLVYTNERELGELQTKYTDSVYLSGNLHL
jgi:hypothetical protein